MVPHDGGSVRVVPSKLLKRSWLRTPGGEVIEGADSITPVVYTSIRWAQSARVDEGASARRQPEVSGTDIQSVSPGLEVSGCPDRLPRLHADVDVSSAEVLVNLGTEVTGRQDLRGGVDDVDVLVRCGEDVVWRGHLS